MAALPIVYSGDPEFRDDLLELAAQVGNRALIGRHYLHVGRQKWTDGTDDMPLKKIFYSLRPAAVLGWMRVNPTSVLPPMNLGQLLEESDPDPELVSATTELLARKAVTRELGRGTVPPAIARFVTEEFALATEEYEHADPCASDESRELASDYFRSAVAKYGGGNDLS
ncbi:MAG: nucleotidyltransferase domain-containing protein [Galbitalea sp.]